MTSVSIDFVAGSHGNFLEYVCNKFFAGIDTDVPLFTNLGASHDKDRAYYNQAVFRALHYSELKIPLSDNVIRIIFEQEDLLPLSSVSLFRAGNAGIDNDQLEHNTFHKLNNEYYHSMITDINTAYPEYMINTVRPDCPRFVLREFFKFGFRDHNAHGFFAKLNDVTSSKAKNVFDFPFRAFYNDKMFLKYTHDLAEWFGSGLINEAGVRQIHQEFLLKNPYVNHKKICDNIISAVIDKDHVAIPDLTLFQESYINGVLEHLTPGLEMPFMQDTYFKNTSDIIEYITCSK